MMNVEFSNEQSSSLMSLELLGGSSNTNMSADSDLSSSMLGQGLMQTEESNVMLAESIRSPLTNNRLTMPKRPHNVIFKICNNFIFFLLLYIYINCFYMRLHYFKNHTIIYIFFQAYFYFCQDHRSNVHKVSNLFCTKVKPLCLSKVSNKREKQRFLS